MFVGLRQWEREVAWRVVSLEERQGDRRWWREWGVDLLGDNRKP